MTRLCDCERKKKPSRVHDCDASVEFVPDLVNPDRLGDRPVCQIIEEAQGPDVLTSIACSELSLELDLSCCCWFLTVGCSGELQSK